MCFCEKMISIVIPVCNRKNVVKTMIESVLHQEYEEWELILVDDGSVDGTFEMLMEYEKKDNRISLFARNRLPIGAQTCRNIGLEVAKGEFIVFFDSDDYIQPYCLRQRINNMSLYPDVDFLVFPAQEFSEIVGDRQRFWGQIVNDDVLSLFLESYIPISGWTNMYRTNSLKRKGVLWDEKLKSKQDVDFNIQNILKGLRFEYAKGSMVDYFFRVETNKGSVSKMVYTREHFDSHVYFYDKTIKSVHQMYNCKYDNELFILGVYFIIMGHRDDMEYIRSMYNLIKGLSCFGIMNLLLSLYLLLYLKFGFDIKISKVVLLPFYIKRKAFLSWYHSRRFDCN